MNLRVILKTCDAKDGGRGEQRRVSDLQGVGDNYAGGGRWMRVSSGKTMLCAGAAAISGVPLQGSCGCVGGVSDD